MQARKSVLILLTNTVGAALGMVTLFFTARYMGAKLLGMFGFAWSILHITALLSDLGFERAHIKRVSEGKDLGDCIATFATVKVTMAVASTAIVVGAAYLLDVTVGFTDSTTFHVFLVVALYFLVFQFASIIVHTYNALRYTALTQFMALTENLVKAPLVILAALIFGFFTRKWVPFSDIPARIIERLHIPGPWTMEQGAVALAAAHVVGIVASLALGGFLFIRHKYPVGRFDRDLFWSYARFALPIASVAIVGIMLRRVDTMMLGYFWNDVEVGIYFAMERVITMLLIIPMAIGTLFFPLVSELSARGERDAVHEVSLSTQRSMSLVMVPAAMIGIVYAPEAIHIFLADEFLPGANTLRLLLVMVVAQSYTMVAKNIITGFDEPGTAAKISLVMMFANLGLNTVFIPDSILGVRLLGLKSTGAALATAISTTLGLLIAWGAARRITGRSHIGRSVALQVAVAAGLGAVLLFTKDIPFLGGLDRWYELGAAVAVGGLLYLGILVLLREVSQKDIDLARDILHPGRMASYVRDEMRGRR